MIVSISRRTDIPAWYADWFLKRLEEGYAMVRNPYRPGQVSRIWLDEEHVECMVFWTKNFAPLLPHIEKLEKFPFYVQYTITSYGRDIEPTVPDARQSIHAFQTLSDRIGKDRVVWRYDPVLLSPRYTLDYHIHYFKVLAQRLQGYTTRCVFSFLDYYSSIQKKMEKEKIQTLNQQEQQRLAEYFASVGAEMEMEVCSCCENGKWVGVKQSSCIDQELIEKITGKKIRGQKDKNQRKGCGCIQSVDIGCYGTCQSQCLYCYAVRSEALVRRNRACYDPLSPILCSRLSEGERVIDRLV